MIARPKENALIGRSAEHGAAFREVPHFDVSQRIENSRPLRQRDDVKSPGRGSGVPNVSPRLLAAFTAYCRWYLGRHFHSIRLSLSSPVPQPEAGPMVIHANHASWWDPLICLLLARNVFPERRLFAPIDQDALERYQFFKRLGFFGVERDTLRGARQFLQTGQTILDHPDSTLWITPQGTFADVRERPPRYRSGLAHLALRCSEVTFVPLAVEIVHWEERLPEALLRFGQPMKGMELIQQDKRPRGITEFLEQQMMATQDALACETQARDSDAFETLLKGGSGVAFLYDAWRRCSAFFSGRKFNPEHSSK